MKIRRLFPLLSVCLYLAGCAPTVRNLPTIVPERLSLIDSKAYTGYLESAKAFLQLEELLLKELGDIELTEANVRDGIFLAEWEKETIGEVFSSYGSKAPLEDFFRMRQVDLKGKRYDPEGKLYLLDDLAQLYTHYLVDFKKAQDYQNRTKSLYAELKRAGLQSLPLSDYYNNRRSIFYSFFYRMKDAIPRDFSLFPGRIDLVTPFSRSYLKKVREMDFLEIRERVVERDRFIKEKLGEVTPLPVAGKADGRPDSRSKIYTELIRFIESTRKEDGFQAKLLQAREAYGAYRNSGSPGYLDDILSFGEDALARQPDQSPATRTASNQINYWVGLAYLKQGNHRLGIRHMEAFLDGIDAYEAMAETAFERKKQVVEQANREEIKAARTKAFWQRAVVVALMAGSAYMSATAQTQAAAGERSIVSAQSVEQGFYNLLPGLGGLYKDAGLVVLDARKKGELRAEVAKYITPYSLKVNRYLDKYEMVDYFLELGSGYEALGDHRKALTQYEEAIRIIERQRTTIYTEKQRISFFAAKQALYRRIIALLATTGQAGKALEYVERSKSRAFVDLLGSSQLTLKSSAQTAKLEDYLRTQAEIDALLSDKSIVTDQLDQVYEKAKRAIVVEEKAAAAPDQTSDLEFLSLSTIQTLNAEEIRDLVGPDACLLEYYMTDDTLAIFLVKRSGISVTVLPVSAETIIDRANRFRDVINRRQDSRSAGKALYDVLIGPVAGKITGSQLIVIPHGVLHYIPFQALYDGNRYLVQSYALSYAPSATVLKFTAGKKSIGNKRMLVVGNPTLDLEFAEREAVSIAKLFQKATHLSRGQATETFLHREGSAYDYIHLATHGEYNEETPLNSRILLSRDQLNDGSLTMAELFSLKWQANLVSLSACETGLSKHRSGDELIGLQRGLIFAGTRSIISSLWSVNDEATEFLMTSFYRSLATMPKDKALQQAQIDTMAAYPDPFFWAAFNLTGARS